MSHSIAVSHSTPDLQMAADHLSQQLQLPIAALQTTAYNYLLTLTPERLELRSTHQRSWTPLFVDFQSSSHQYRQHRGGGKNQLIAKAVGIKTANKPTIWDLTAGLGGDGFVLATLGCPVTLFERSPIIGALLKDGLDRAYNALLITPDELHLINSDASAYLSPTNTLARPDVIYYDPMFCPTKKSALVKKDMRILRDIVGNDDDSQTLVQAALRHAQRRVVVKRARHAPLLTNHPPDVQYNGQRCRYDVYFNHTL